MAYNAKTRATIILVACATALYVMQAFLRPHLYFPSSGGRGYTLGAQLFIFATWPLVCHAVVLGVPCFGVGLALRRLSGSFRVFAVLFLLSGVVAAAQAVLEVLVFEPQIQQGTRELALRGTVDGHLLDPESRLLGHWESMDRPLTHYYFGKDEVFTVVQTGGTAVGQWAVVANNDAEDSVVISMKLPNQPTKVRKILFGIQQRAAMIFEEQGKEVGEVLHHLDLDEKP
ncbi:MAG: hypothetical protein JW955_03305 [Sedimentisphaerales bacterium]|nr:hypothetical protein [Sedimentisphaerales bacterium]